MDINSVSITCNLVADPAFEVSYNGAPVAKMGVAINESFYGTIFVDAVAFGKQAQFLATNAKKGDKLFVIGALRSRHFITEDGRRANAICIRIIKAKLYSKNRPEEIFEFEENYTGMEDADNEG